MKSDIYYLQFPHGPPEGIIRGIVIIIVLIALSFFFNQKLYIVPNILLGSALGTIYTDDLAETVLFSAMLGLCFYGYYFFRATGVYCTESYYNTGRGIVICILAGMAGYGSVLNQRSN